LSSYVELSPDERKRVEKASQLFPMAITPYYASLMDRTNAKCPIRMQAVPTIEETSIASADMADPLHEDKDSPVFGLTHRYPDRVLLIATNQCAMYCRHCTRKRKVGDKNLGVSLEKLEPAFRYIEDHEEIRDVLVSGGDPFLLSNDRLDALLRRIRSIDHVEIIRIGTRTPVVLPQRITPALVDTLKKHHPLWINTHFNHPREFTDASRAALARLADAGLPLGNQTVLLRDINDCPLVMRELAHRLVMNRVRPYYLYQCDLSRGIEHFRTPIAKGIEIMEMMIGHTSGFAVPKFVVDAPGGGGKIPLKPDYLVSMGTRKVALRNYEGVICLYSEPKNRETTCPDDCTYCDDNVPKGHRWAPDVGIGKLFDETNETISLIPENLERIERQNGSGDSEG